MLFSCASPDRNKYPVAGVDVSHHQGEIDWARVRQEGFAFAYVKATEGEDWVDTMHQRNVDEASKAGLLVGSYHFFTFCRDGDLQAANFVVHVEFKRGDLPPVVDLEYKGNCDERPTREKMISEIRKFLEIVEGAAQAKAIIYTTSDFYRDYLMNEFPENPVWYRDILIGEPTLPDGRKWLFWQYRVTKIGGIRTDVDHNVYSGSLEDLKAMALTLPPPPDTWISPPPPERDTASWWDSDHDGFSDRQEIDSGTDPQSPMRFPGSHKMVLVTTMEIPAGAVLRPEMVSQREVFARGEAPESVADAKDSAQWIGRKLRHRMMKGDWVTPGFFR